MSRKRDHLLTEQRLADSMNLDSMTVADAIALMNQQDAIAVAAVVSQSANVANAINLVVHAFQNNGRLFYFGAGTSGRLGVLDASECPPTFRSDPLMVQGIIAGGPEAMLRAKEGAEDSASGGAAAVDACGIGSNDAVMGIAAGGTTPFVHGALRRAIELGAKTIFLSCVQPVADEPAVDVVIRPLTGPEVLTGSTRLKAGTATKLILNQITTIAMVQLGKCYENLMVDLKASNEKLRDRAVRIVVEIAKVSYERAVEILLQADGDVKVAIVMQCHGVSIHQANERLDQCEGNLRRALVPVPYPGTSGEG